MVKRDRNVSNEVVMVILVLAVMVICVLPFVGLVLFVFGDDSE